MQRMANLFTRSPKSREHRAQINTEELPLPLFPLSRDHHAIDVGQAGLHHDCIDRIMDRLHVQAVCADNDEVCLLAGCQCAQTVQRL